MKTPRTELEIRRRQRSIVNNIRGVWIADETLSSRVFDTSSQSKQKLSEGENREVKSSKSMLIKTVYPNLLHGCDFCFNLMNYY